MSEIAPQHRHDDGRAGGEARLRSLEQFCAFVRDNTEPHDRKLLEAFAVAMHALTCGDWGAAGFETKERFRAGAAAAIVALAAEGLDLLSLLPKSARGEMPW